MRDLVLNFIEGGGAGLYVTYLLSRCRLMSPSINLISFFKYCIYFLLSIKILL